MSNSESEQPTPRDLIREEAEKNDVPPRLLFELYTLEQELITEEHRSKIGKKVREIVEKHVSEERE